MRRKYGNYGRKESLSIGCKKLLEDYEDFKFIDSHVHFDLLYKRIVPKYKKKDPKHNKYQVLKDSMFTRDERVHKVIFKSLDAVIDIYCEPTSLSPSFSLYKELSVDDKDFNHYCSFGLHPHEAKSYNDTIEKNIYNLLEYEKTVAFGEIGLDFHYSRSPHDVQKKVFIRQLEIAKEKKLPVIIHSRDAEEDTLKILKEHLPSDWFIHIHCYTSPKDNFGNELLKHFKNLYIGFTGILTYNSTKDTLQKFAASVPLDRILLESDGPYLAARNKKYLKGKTDSHCLNIPFIGLTIAEIKGEKFEDVMNQIYKNTKRMYNIK